MLKENFSFLSESSKNLLAIFGVIGLIYGAFNWPGDVIKSAFEKAFNYDAFVKPTCEPLLSLNLKDSDGATAGGMLIGLTIRAPNEIDNLSFTIRDLSYIRRWAINSDNLSKEQQKEILKSLPSGAISDPYIVGSIPKLMANSQTTIQIEGVAKPGFDCASEWFNLSSPNTKIALLQIEDFHQIRGAGLGISGGPDSFYKWLSFALIIILLALISKASRKSEVKKERFRISRKKGQQ